MFKTGRALPQRADSEQTRTQIFETALSLFREKGFDGTTIREIAARTGLSLGATYYYFPSKEAIVAAYYDHVQDQHRVRAFAAFAQQTTLKERLRAAYHTKLDVMLEDRGLLRALFRSGKRPGPSFVNGLVPPLEPSARPACVPGRIGGRALCHDDVSRGAALLWTLHGRALLISLRQLGRLSRRVDWWLPRSTS